MYQSESIAFADFSIISISFSTMLGILIGCLLTIAWKKYKWYGLKGHYSTSSDNSHVNNNALSSQRLHSVSRDAHSIISAWPSKKNHYSYYLHTGMEFSCDVLSVIDEEMKCIGEKHKQLNLMYTNKLEYKPVSPISHTWFTCVIRELLNNSIKHNWKCREIKIELTTSVQDNYFIVCIADNGIGLTSTITNMLDAIDVQKETISLKLFTNTESTNLANIKVGLHQLEGSLEVFSARHFLTKIILKIPLLDQKQDPNSVLQRAPIRPAQAKVKSTLPTILVLSQQNESDLNKVYQLRNHFNLHWSSSIEDGARLARVQNLDCVLFDTETFEAASTINLEEWQNKDGILAEIPIILFEEHANRHAKFHRIPSGVSAFIAKSSTAKHIALTIEKVISEKQRVVEKVSEGIANYHLRLISANNVNNQDDIKFLERFTLMMRENYANERFNRPEAAKHILMTEKTLSRRLQYHYKLGFTEILRQFRLQQAKELLLNGEQVTTAAYNTGFNSPSYFSKCFRDEYGFAPSQLTK